MGFLVLIEGKVTDILILELDLILLAYIKFCFAINLIILLENIFALQW